MGRSASPFGVTVTVETWDADDWAGELTENEWLAQEHRLVYVRSAVADPSTHSPAEGWDAYRYNAGLLARAVLNVCDRLQELARTHGCAAAEIRTDRCGIGYVEFMADPHAAWGGTILGVAPEVQLSVPTYLAETWVGYLEVELAEALRGDLLDAPAAHAPDHLEFTPGDPHHHLKENR